MATSPLPHTTDAALQRSWRTHDRLSRWADHADSFLAQSSTDRGPWLAVSLACGIGIWFAIPSGLGWLAVITVLILSALWSVALWRGREDRRSLLMACVGVPVACAMGLGLIWLRSGMVGTPAIERPQASLIDARILEREEQPADDRVRLILAMRSAETGTAMKVRVNVPLAQDLPTLTEGARVRMRARLMPPAPPLIPGAYDFARASWFSGLSASGTVIGTIEVVEVPPTQTSWLASTQRSLARHVRANVAGSEGTIAAAFASGDRGAIAKADDDAMRDAGLTHLLSISGLHVSALMAACYFMTLKLLALWPWLTLRVRLPMIAGASGAIAGIGYTLLTGAEVPTVRSCLAALLVLLAMLLGREALSLRMIAVAATIVMLLWPESVIGPSFQMSFAAVTAIVALHGSAPLRAWLAPRAEPWWHRLARHGAALFITGIVIELALTPIVLFHFHRAGFYGAFANVIAIPLVTFCAMPLIALALLLDLLGLGGPIWWLVAQSLRLLLAIAHFTAAQPGAVKLFPQMGLGTMALFVAGILWVALWRGWIRLAGLLPIAFATCLLAVTPAPDVLISGDGRHVGVRGAGDRLLVLRASRSDYATDHLREMAALDGEPLPMDRWPDARCNQDFCILTLQKGERRWRMLLSRSNAFIEERQLAAVCGQVDIVIASRRLPRSCQPAWLKADRTYLASSGGLALYLKAERVSSVAERQGAHGWWREAKLR